MYTATIKTNSFGRTNLLMIDDDGRVEVTPFAEFDMVALSPIPNRFNFRNRFSLTKEHNTLLVEALKTPPGRALLRHLKNDKTNGIIDDYLKGQKKPTYLGMPIDELVAEPLTGNNHIDEATIGLSKKEIWEAFISNGLIKL